jgi:ABC-type sugar transport system substrate-binding protein
MSVFRIAGGVLAAAVLCVLAIALWPASEADKARDDGERVGEAVTQLYYAESSTEVDAALAELDAAVSDTRAHAGDEVADQVADQQDALARAAEGFVGYYTTDSDWDQALYEAELEIALDDLYYNAEDFREQGPEVNDAFWEGVDDGMTIEA